MIKKISKSVIVSILRLFNRILILLNKHLTKSKTPEDLKKVIQKSLQSL